MSSRLSCNFMGVFTCGKQFNQYLFPHVILCAYTMREGVQLLLQLSWKHNFLFSSSFWQHFSFSHDMLILFLFFFSSSYEQGGHFYLPSYIMRTHGARQQRAAVKNAPKNQLKPVFEVCRLDCLAWQLFFFPFENPLWN